MKINIANLDKVETGREPLDPGKYEVKITECKSTDDAGAELVSKDKGTPYIQWVGTVMNHEKRQGRQVWWRTYLSEGALFNVAGLLDALGVERGVDGFSTEDCLGKNVIITITHREYEGNIQEDVAPQYKKA